MADDAARDPWLEGIELFNAGRFFDCHEAWEEIWKTASGPDKLFYQGMIQMAVAILHAERGNRRGALAAWEKARARLEPLSAEHRGIALGEFCEAVAGFIADARVGNPSAPPPKIRRI